MRSIVINCSYVALTRATETLVLTVGASGKLGQYMVQHALDRGYEVVGVCRDASVESSMPSRSASRSYKLLTRVGRGLVRGTNHSMAC